jgi:uncharacterized spore protein YtfJ
MFQTPQMRQGGGIMAGVAPIRGYADGDFVDSATGMLRDTVEGFRTLITNPKEFLSPEAVQQLESLSEAEAIGLAETGQLSEAALLTLMSIHPVLRRLKGLKPKPKPGPRRGLTAEQQAEGLPKKAEFPLTAQQQAEGLSKTRPTPKTPASKKDAPEEPTPGAVARAKDAVSSATSRVTGPIKTTGSVIKGVGKLGAGAAGAAAVTDLTTGSDYLSTGLSAALRAALKAGRITKEEYDKFMATPEISALSEFLSGPDAPETPASKSNKKGGGTGGGGGGTKTKPKTFLDMLKGAGTQFKDFLQDPANQYALAKAGQATEGIAPRNLASDFFLGKEEYRQLEAQREDETALMKNLEVLKAEYPNAKPGELIDLLLSGTNSPKRLFQSLFTEKFGSGIPVSQKDLNQMMAISGYQPSPEEMVNLGLQAAPAAKGQNATIDLEPTE